MDERMLYEMKWHDYRMLSPRQANFIFLQHFMKAYQSYSERRRGNKYINPLAYKVRSKDQKTGKMKTKTVSVPVENVETEWPSWKVLVELRQWADSKGMKYDDFWKWAFKAINERKFRYFAVNFCKNPKILGTINEYSQEAQLIQLSEFSLFKPDQYRDLEIQNDYYWYLVNSIKRKYLGQWKEKVSTAADDGLISWDFLRTYTREFKTTHE